MFCFHARLNNVKKELKKCNILYKSLTSLRFSMFNINAGHEAISLVHMVKTRKSNPSISTITKINFLLLFLYSFPGHRIHGFNWLIGLSKD